MRRPRPVAQVPVVLIEIDVDQIAIPAGLTDLVVRVANSGEANVPVFFGLCCEAFRFTRDREHFATGSPDLVKHPSFNIAPQLGAAGGSPSASIEKQQHKIKFRELIVQPARANPEGRIE